MLRFYTARINYAGADRFDVTRKSGGPDGHPFAPSWAILRPALDARREADRLAKAGLFHDAAVIESNAWIDYVPAYIAEMRVSYGANRPAWDALLSRERVVLVCYCVDRAHCHRSLLAAILVKLGAEYWGETT